MKIITEKNKDFIGPFDEDATLILICIVTGGNSSFSSIVAGPTFLRVVVAR